MPPRRSSTIGRGSVRRRGGSSAHLGDVDGEGGGAHLAVVAELQEQAVGAGCGELGVERRGRLLVGVDVEVGEVAVAQGDEVAAGAEVRRHVGDDLAVAADGELRARLLAGDRCAGELDRVAVAGVAGAATGRAAAAGWKSPGTKRSVPRVCLSPSTTKSANTR